MGSLEEVICAIRDVRQADVVEIVSPHRVAAEAAHMGLAPGFALGLEVDIQGGGSLGVQQGEPRRRGERTSKNAQAEDADRVSRMQSVVIHAGF